MLKFWKKKKKKFNRGYCVLKYFGKSVANMDLKQYTLYSFYYAAIRPNQTKNSTIQKAIDSIHATHYNKLQKSNNIINENAIVLIHVEPIIN